MNIVDSSAWLEYFADGPNAEHFAGPIEDTAALVVPSITLLEVFKRIAQQRDEALALKYIAVMQQGEVIDLDPALALRAAAAGLRHKLPLADSIIYATAQSVQGIVWTQDADFKELDGVRFWPGRTR
jgi:predicted nucleic acid-binding protein